MQATTYSTYPIFEADQVLTSKHLNDLVNYLEEQERLTRNRLIGIGIACGLEVSLSADGTTVSISPGAGITSDGHLVAFHGNAFGEPAHYSFFRPFAFGEREPYDFFKKAGKALDLYDLHEQKVEEAEPFTEIEGGIEDYVVFLFLDCLDKKLKNCVENDCNEKGTERSFNLRPLLVKRSDARDIICREEELDVPKTEDQIDLHVNARFYLPALEIPRFRLGGNRLSHFNDLYVRYDSIIGGYIPNLQQALRTAYDRFRPILKNGFGNTNPFLNNGSTDLQAKYLTVKNKSPFAVQYFYDMLRDLTDTYNEFREVVFDLMCECCPAPGRFPKHLRLGHLGAPVTCEPSPYRTRFIYAPVINEQGDLKQRVLSLFSRMTLLAAKFVVPAVEQIRITPGREMKEALSLRAIPYYYNILNEGNLLKNWNAGQKRKCRYNENLSYHSNRYAGSISHVLNPLQYDHDQYGFLRIEGHLGMNYRTALTNILNTRNQENLPFDVVVLALSENASGTTIDFSECHFRDLEIMCQAWRKELECMLGEVVKGLSKVDVNLTLKRATTAPRDTTTPFRASFHETTNRPFLLASAAAGERRIGINVPETVKESIETKETTIGFVLNEAVKTATVGGGDYYVHAETLLLKDEDIRQLNRDEYELAFAAPMLVASRAVALAENVTGTCDELDIEKLEALMRELVAAATNYQNLLTNYKGTATAKVNVNVLQMIRLMSILVGRCTLEQLKIIKAEIELRKEQLRKMNLFAEYVAKNPGIDHHGGVPKGGTFLLVYHDISLQDTATHKGPSQLRGRVVDEKNQPLAGVSVLVKGTTKGTTTDQGGNFSIQVDQLPATLVASLAGVETLELVVTDPQQSILLKPGTDGVNIEVFPVPQRFSVIADFYLPYQCCSDCPPIDYVILPPEGKEALELTPKSFCMPVDPNFQGALFSVYPARGIVTGLGVTGDVATGFVFKPNDIDMGNNDEVVVTGFKVNGEEVPLTIMLYKKPEAKFSVVVEPVDQTGDGLFGQLILQNQSSENAVKFVWVIQRVLINGNFVENHVVETEKRDNINLDTFFKRGEEFRVKLTAYSKNCENQTEQMVDVPFKAREVALSLFDPQGKQMTTTTIDLRTADGIFTLLATPGQGDLEPKDVLKKLKIELAAATKESNKYVFKAIGGNGTFELKYTLPEGPSNTISLTYTRSGGGGSTNPVITRPGDFNNPVILRPVIGGPRDVAGPPQVGILASHPATLAALRNDPQFRTLLGPASDAFKVTGNLTEDLLSRLADSTLAAEVAAGKFNKDFSAKMSVALKDTARRLGAAEKAKDRDITMTMLKLQLEQITSLAAIQAKDLSASDPLSKLVTKAISEVKKLQVKGVKTDKKKAVSKSLSAIVKTMEGKTKTKERLDSLIAQVKKG